MNQSYATYGGDPRSSQSSNPNSAGITFHPSFHPTPSYNASNSSGFHSNNSSFIPSGEYKVPAMQQQPMRIANADSDDRRIAALLDSYFIETPTASSWGPPTQPNNAPPPQTISSYSQPQPANAIGTQMKTPKISPEKKDRDKLKRAKQAEAARQRYHRLSPQEKRELNMKRTLAQKRKRQREKEIEELEEILRESNDIQEDPEVTDQLRERRMRAKWAEAARARYQRMSSEERRVHNNKRRMRQMQNAIAATKAEGLTTGDPVKDEETIRRHMKDQNAKKAHAARERYHRMSDEEKRIYNQRRTEAFRRRRMEEEMLLAMPIGRINGEALDRAQQIVVRNAKRAEAARLRYQRMTPDQRKIYNQKRYTPKRKRIDTDQMSMTGTPTVKKQHHPEDDVDALTTLERDVVKRTQQAQQVIARQRQYIVPPQNNHHIQNAHIVHTPTDSPVVHHVQPQQMNYSSNNQGLMVTASHMPIVNPYGSRP